MEKHHFELHLKPAKGSRIIPRLDFTMKAEGKITFL